MTSSPRTNVPTGPANLCAAKASHPVRGELNTSMYSIEARATNNEVAEQWTNQQ